MRREQLGDAAGRRRCSGSPRFVWESRALAPRAADWMLIPAERWMLSSMAICAPLLRIVLVRQGHWVNGGRFSF